MWNSEWAHNAKALEAMGIDPGLLGKKVKLDNGHWGEIAGLAPRNRKMPFIIVYNNGNSAMKMSLSKFKNYIK